MPTTTVFADASDGYVWGESTTYLTARSTPSFTNEGFLQVGQKFTTFYSIYEIFLAFDTTGLTDVTSATLAIVDADDQSATDFTIECRLHDWGATMETADYVPGADLGSKTLLATYATSAGWTGATYKTFTDVAFAANINASGFTRVVLASDRMRLATVPTGNEYVGAQASESAGTSADPKLTVVTSDPPIIATFGAPRVRLAPTLRMS